MIRQGEILLIPVDAFTDNDDEYKVAKPDASRLIVGHSETGHHHVIDLERSPSAELLIHRTNEFIGRLKLGEDAVLEHLRSFDTHEPVRLEKGFYEVRWRREHTPEGLRRVQD